jgi:hypothetical protein
LIRHFICNCKRLCSRSSWMSYCECFTLLLMVPPLLDPRQRMLTPPGPSGGHHLSELHPANVKPTDGYERWVSRPWVHCISPARLIPDSLLRRYWVTSFLGVALFVMITLTFWRVMKRWALENSVNAVRELPEEPLLLAPCERANEACVSA